MVGAAPKVLPPESPALGQAPQTSFIPSPDSQEGEPSMQICFQHLPLLPLPLSCLGFWTALPHRTKNLAEGINII